MIKKRKRKLVRVGEEYYIHSKQQRKWIEAIGAMPLNQYDEYGLDLFLWKIDTYWHIFEGKTGMSLFCLSGTSTGKFGGMIFIPDLETAIPKIKSQIKARIAERGICPRYKYKVIK